MAISFVSAVTAFSNIGSLASFNVTKPADVVEGDVMLAVIAGESTGSARTVTLSGWTLVKQASGTGDSSNVQVSVFTRVVEAADPATWNGTFSGNCALITTASAAWRGVQAIGASGTSSTGLGTSLATATVNSTAANAWRVVAGAYNSGSATYTITSNEAIRRVLFVADDSASTGATQAAIWDSNAVVATGNTSRTVSRSASWSVAASVILLLNPTTGTPATGTWSSTTGSVTSSADGEVNNNATLATSLAPVVAASSGYGQPPVVTGTLATALAPVSASLAGGTAATGEMTATASVTASMVGETRFFGVRVIVVDADDRTIRVESRGVAD